MGTRRKLGSGFSAQHSDNSDGRFVACGAMSKLRRGGATIGVELRCVVCPRLAVLDVAMGGNADIHRQAEHQAR